MGVYVETVSWALPESLYGILFLGLTKHVDRSSRGASTITELWSHIFWNMAIVSCFQASMVYLTSWPPVVSAGCSAREPLHLLNLACNERIAAIMSLKESCPTLRLANRPQLPCNIPLKIPLERGPTVGSRKLEYGSGTT